MLEKGPDPDMKLMKEGVFRVFKDEDGLAANDIWPESQFPLRARAKNAFIPEILINK